MSSCELLWVFSLISIQKLDARCYYTGLRPWWIETLYTQWRLPMSRDDDRKVTNWRLSLRQLRVRESQGWLLSPVVRQTLFLYKLTINEWTFYWEMQLVAYYSGKIKLGQNGIKSRMRNQTLPSGFIWQHDQDGCICYRAMESVYLRPIRQWRIASKFLRRI